MNGMKKNDKVINMIKGIIWIATGLMVLSVPACHQKKNGIFEVKGSFKNASGLDSALAAPPPAAGRVTKLYLAEVEFGRDQTPVLLDSAKLMGENGSFAVRAKGRQGGIYELIFGENVLAVPLINDADEIHLDIDLGRRDNFYSVEGSEASKKLEDLIDGFGKKNIQVEKSFAVLDSLKAQNVPDSLMITASESKNRAIRDLNGYLRNFLHSTSNPTLAWLTLGWSSRSFPTSEFDSLLSEAQGKYPGNLQIGELKASYDQQQAAINQQNNAWVGKPAPDLTLPDAAGKAISISSFRGKYLLVDFWASWCGPCRQENPNVVKVYNEFKDKNFTILGVSLDKEKQPWLEAIQKDNLAWTHVSDLKFWNSKAVEIFKFEGIPFNVLIDPQGKIVAQELRGADLEDKLRSLLK
jgi:peroxiredoxin